MMDALLDLQDRIPGDSWALGIRAAIAMLGGSYIIISIATGQTDTIRLTLAASIGFMGLVSFIFYATEMRAVYGTISELTTTTQQHDLPTGPPVRETQKRNEDIMDKETFEQTVNIPDFLQTGPRQFTRKQ